MSIPGRILTVEDDPKDVELALTALEEYNVWIAFQREEFRFARRIGIA